MKGAGPAAQETLIVIPARMASERLPGKPLADIGGVPMIVHVWRRAREAGCGEVVVAAGEREIADAITAHGGRALVTAPDLPSGSDRVAAALAAIDGDGRYTTVINLQGDLPAIAPADIARSVAALAEPAADLATLAVAGSDPEERADPNVVKLVGEFDEATGLGRARDFLRLLPADHDGPHFHHIGIYAFRRTALEAFVRLPRSLREKERRLEQMRALDAGMRIDAALVDTVPVGVDTPADLERVRGQLAGKSASGTGE